MIAAILGQIRWEHIVAGVGVWLITQLLASWVATQILKRDTRSLMEAIKALTATVARHETQLGQAREDRGNCELRAADKYATRAELARLISDHTVFLRRHETKIEEAARRSDEKIDKVHTRITDLATSVAAIRSKVGG
ncbi:MAG TPA: hypothetical protein VNA25_09465 [Phycisphaerae bacterium]|nr:hypothetical protein [Phycisphaerae bacterium]